MARKCNFGAGPAALPEPVLKIAQEQMMDFDGNGMSIMEMSHRSKGYDAVHRAAEANLRELMGISDDYAVLFLPGGASQQFALLPMNLRGEGQSIDLIHTGAWAGKAYKEALVTGAARLAWDGKAENYMRMPKAEELDLSADAAYVHICTNETIGGIRFPVIPTTAAPLVADMSSEIMSRPINVSDYGVIFAGAQKNIGPSGLAVVIIRKDLIDRCPASVPVFLRYSTHAKEDSLYNTPNTWAIYMVKLVTDWLKGLGGVAAIEKMNEEKAALLYGVIDSSDFWRSPVDRECRSTMNVVWRLPSEELEAQFIKEATAAGLIGLKGHRSVGGLRASIYNACPRESVVTLANFMKEFERTNG